MKVRSEQWDSSVAAMKNLLKDVINDNELDIRKCVTDSNTDAAKITFTVTLQLTDKSHEVGVKFKADSIQKGASDKRTVTGEDPDQGQLPIGREELAGAFGDIPPMPLPDGDVGEVGGEAPPPPNEQPEPKAKGKRGRKPKAEA